jgi:hypothetical protein
MENPGRQILPGSVHHRQAQTVSGRPLQCRGTGARVFRRSELARVALAKEPRRRQQNGQMIKSFKLFAWLVLVAFSAAAFRAAIPNH